MKFFEVKAGWNWMKFVNNLSCNLSTKKIFSKIKAEFLNILNWEFSSYLIVFVKKPRRTKWKLNYSVSILFFTCFEFPNANPKCREN